MDNIEDSRFTITSKFNQFRNALLRVHEQIMYPEGS